MPCTKAFSTATVPTTNRMTANTMFISPLRFLLTLPAAAIVRLGGAGVNGQSQYLRYYQFVSFVGLVPSPKLELIGIGSSANN